MTITIGPVLAVRGREDLRSPASPSLKEHGLCPIFYHCSFLQKIYQVSPQVCLQNGISMFHSVITNWLLWHGCSSGPHRQSDMEPEEHDPLPGSIQILLCFRDSCKYLTEKVFPGYKQLLTADIAVKITNSSIFYSVF